MPQEVPHSPAWSLCRIVGSPARMASRRARASCVPTSSPSPGGPKPRTARTGRDQAAAGHCRFLRSRLAREDGSAAPCTLRTGPRVGRRRRPGTPRTDTRCPQRKRFSHPRERPRTAPPERPASPAALPARTRRAQRLCHRPPRRPRPRRHRNSAALGSSPRSAPVPPQLRSRPGRIAGTCRCRPCGPGPPLPMAAVRALRRVSACSAARWPAGIAGRWRRQRWARSAPLGGAGRRRGRRGEEPGGPGARAGAKGRSAACRRLPGTGGALPAPPPGSAPAPRPDGPPRLCGNGAAPSQLAPPLITGAVRSG